MHKQVRSNLRESKDRRSLPRKRASERRGPAKKTLVTVSVSIRETLIGLLLFSAYLFVAAPVSEPVFLLQPKASTFSSSLTPGKKFQKLSTIRHTKHTNHTKRTPAEDFDSSVARMPASDVELANSQSYPDTNDTDPSEEFDVVLKAKPSSN